MKHLKKFESFLSNNTHKEDYVIKGLINNLKNYTKEELETFLTNNNIVLSNYKIRSNIRWFVSTNDIRYEVSRKVYIELYNLIKNKNLINKIKIEN